jgi:hypothetical protein
MSLCGASFSSCQLSGMTIITWNSAPRQDSIETPFRDRNHLLRCARLESKLNVQSAGLSRDRLYGEMGAKVIFAPHNALRLRVAPRTVLQLASRYSTSVERIRWLDTRAIARQVAHCERAVKMTSAVLFLTTSIEVCAAAYEGH